MTAARLARGAQLIGAVAILAPVAGCGGESSPSAGMSASSTRALQLTTRLPANYQHVCDRLAEYAPARARTCPPLIPAGSLKVTYANPYARNPRYRDGYVVDLASHSIDRLGHKRIETKGGHWLYEVAWSPIVIRNAVLRGVERPANAEKASPCRRARVAGEAMEACRVLPYEQGGGLNGGHTAYVWGHAGVAYIVSLHGYANEPRARAMVAALAADVLG